MQKPLTWVFDLDNTLHDARPHIFPHLSRSMTAYLREHLTLDESAASALRIHYWRTYGATLLGLMRHHGTDPGHFLRETHQFPDLARMVIAEGGLKQALRRLRGRKILFSNAPQHYVKAVVNILRIAELFDARSRTCATSPNLRSRAFGCCSRVSASPPSARCWWRTRW
jgi:putative hydrolase of the HAD superfamily